MTKHSIIIHTVPLSRRTILFRYIVTYSIGIRPQESRINIRINIKFPNFSLGHHFLVVMVQPFVTYSQSVLLCSSSSFSDKHSQTTQLTFLSLIFPSLTTPSISSTLFYPISTTVSHFLRTPSITEFKGPSFVLSTTTVDELLLVTTFWSNYPLPHRPSIHNSNHNLETSNSIESLYTLTPSGFRQSVPRYVCQLQYRLGLT